MPEKKTTKKKHTKIGVQNLQGFRMLPHIKRVSNQ